VKKAVLSVIHDGDYTVVLGRSVPILDEMKLQVADAMERMRGKLENVDMWMAVQQKPNPKATFTAYVWQSLESEILMTMLKHITSEGYAVGVLKHDGLLVERTSVSCPVSLLRSCEEAIDTEVGVRVTLTEKSHEATHSDIDKLYGPMSLFTLRKDVDKVKYMCMREAMTNGYKRMGLDILAPHASIPGVFTELPNQAGGAQNFINRVIHKHNLDLTSMDKVVDWFQKCTHPRFELLSRSSFDDGVISFLDGFLSIRTALGTPMEFIRWQDHQETPPLTRHFFDQLFPVAAWESNTFRTPKWDTILADQLISDDGDDDVVQTLEQMIGRLFFPIEAFDNWQQCPMIIGDANTGKSSVCDIIRAMFPALDVGIISSSLESQFGLDAVAHKRVVLVPDMPTDIHKKLNASDFQSMVTGENISVAKKYKDAQMIEWKCPMFWVGNEYPNWKDAKGSIKRRCCIFKFENLVKNRVTNLVRHIVKDELVLIMLRCLRRYKERAYEIEGEDWAGNCPDKLKEWSQEASIQMNPQAEFLANGSDYYRIIYEEGAQTSLNDFRQAYKNYMQFDKGVKNPQLSTDRYATKAAGFIDKKVQICTTCDKPCTRTTCGDHYNAQNRTKKVFFTNMRIIKLKGREQHQVQFVL
jgi:hypothetical protein